jgi:hypothetical protein
MKLKNLTKKFAKNLYFKEIRMVSNNEVELNGILPALENKGQKQADSEDFLKKRISKFLGFEPNFTINY